MNKTLFSCILVTFTHTLQQSHAACTVRSDGPCFYTLACSAPATFRPAFDCNDIDPYITLHIKQSSGHNITANHFISEFDSFVRILSAIGNNWHYLQNNAFSNFKNVLYMDLSENHIKMLGAAFRGLEQMDSLNLSRNHIETIKPGVLQVSHNRSRLYMLDLSYNLLMHLSGEAFVNMNNLRSLYLQGNKLKTLGDHFFVKLKHLNYLNLCCSNMGTLRMTFKYLPSLKELNLSYNRLKKIDLSKVMSLETIDLSHNDFEEMYFEDFKGLPIIKVDLSFNKLKELNVEDSVVGSNASRPLVKLYLHNNNIEYIDESFFNIFSYIAILNLSYNNIVEFKADTFRYVNVLKILIVSNNRRLRLADDISKELPHTFTIGKFPPSQIQNQVFT
ncbi:tsukushin-like [Spodoptera litura]|uniref:Tsukushin-like n=1 Tax=Spodoptera litura TaxID=69820 RepID=A0A9J7IUJ1_SPOLT|nr:tsukushin-like [Spodoptera litura]